MKHLTYTYQLKFKVASIPSSNASEPLAPVPTIYNQLNVSQPRSQGFSLEGGHLQGKRPGNEVGMFHLIARRRNTTVNFLSRFLGKHILI